MSWIVLKQQLWVWHHQAQCDRADVLMLNAGFWFCIAASTLGSYRCRLFSAALWLAVLSFPSYMQLRHHNGTNKVHFTWAGADKCWSSIVFQHTAANYLSARLENGSGVVAVVAGNTKTKNNYKSHFFYIWREVQIRVRHNLQASLYFWIKAMPKVWTCSLTWRQETWLVDLFFVFKSDVISSSSSLSDVERQFVAMSLKNQHQLCLYCYIWAKAKEKPITDSYNCQRQHSHLQHSYGVTLMHKYKSVLSNRCHHRSLAC